VSVSLLSATSCPRCGAAVPRGLRYCGNCGADLLAPELAEPAPEGDWERESTGVTRFAVRGVAALALTAALALSLLAYLNQRNLSAGERAAWQRAVADVRAEVGALQEANALLSGRVDSAQKRSQGAAPLAQRALKSVFTVETDSGLGAGFAAWTQGGVIYLVTAEHVIADARSPFVTVSRKGASWSGEIVRRDRANDLALIRVSGRPQGAKPLWQKPTPNVPKPGDELLLIGSPYGLDGTVTTGVVSRVSKKAIQTDAAANPGNSGGPAIDLDGRIVGVLVAGGGQNINFAVPIARACAKLRDC
jgi:S1-C subfamily serine protease